MRVQSLLHLYTDGACHAGIGGFAGVLVNPSTGKHIEVSDGPFIETTNNQMEMMAVIAGLEFVHRRIGAQNIKVYSDSKYVVRGITEWINSWKRNGWFTAKNKLVKNAALWQRMEAARNRHRFTCFQWVRGHNGDKFNELADTLAVSMRTRNSKTKALGQTA